MELKEGMYIRYIPTLGEYTQKISKITKTKNCLLDMAYTLDNEKEPVFSSHFDDIIKTSYNLIDLIEEGDYINGVLVESIYSREKDKMHFHTFETEIMIEVTKENINNILTKEQFESMVYKIKD